MDLSKLTRQEQIVGGGGIVLLVDLLFLPWHHESVTFAGVSVSASQSATSSPDAIWGVLAVLLALAVVVDLALARFYPQTQVPTTKLGRDMTRVAAAGLMLGFLLIKLIAQTKYLGFGAYAGLILAAVVAGAAYRIAQADKAAA